MAGKELSRSSNFGSLKLKPPLIVVLLQIHLMKDFFPRGIFNLHSEVLLPLTNSEALIT